LNLKNKLTMLFSVLTALIILVFSIIGYLFSQDQVMQGIQQEMKASVAANVHMLNGWLSGKAKMLEIVSGTLTSMNGDGEITVPMLAGYKFVDKEVSDMYFGTVDGRMIDGSGWVPAADYDPRTRSWYKGAKDQEKLSYGDPYLDIVTNQMAVAVAMPIKNSSGQMRGILSEDILLQTLVDNVKNINLQGAGYAFLVDAKGVVLAHPDAELVSKNVFEAEKLSGMTTAFKELVANNQGILRVIDHGEGQIIAYQKMPTTGWTLAISVPEAVVYKPLGVLKWVFGLAAFFSILLVIIVTYFIAKRITKPLEMLAGQVDLVTAGSLTVKAVVTGKDEVAHLAVSFNKMVDNLRALITKVHASSEQVAASSEQLTASAEQSAEASNQVAISIAEVAQGTEQQVQAITKAAGVVEQTSLAAAQVAQRADKVADTSNKAADAALKGGQAVSLAVGQMLNIEKAVTHSSEIVVKLGERSKEIGQIVDTISGIAGQTNLLALNAAIEAARAGEQGKGFAVVADEVRKLAEQSQIAAKQIADLISKIQGETDSAVTAMSAGAREAKVGNEVVNTAGETFSQIVELINKVSTQVNEISTAINQIAIGSQDVVNVVQDIERVNKATAAQTQTVSAATEEQSASMEEIAAASQALARMAEEMQNAIGKFSI